MDGEQNAQARHCAVENNNAKFQIPARFDGNRNMSTDDSIRNCVKSSEELPLPALNLPDSEIFSETREENQHVGPLYTNTNDSTLEQSVNNAPDAPDAPMHQRESARENFGKPSNKYNDFYM